MALLRAVMGFIIFILIVFGGWFIYENFLAGEIQELDILNYNPDVEASLEEVSGDVEQFYKNMRFNHKKISYYINTECGSEKVSRMKEAFGMFSGEVNGLITFYSTSEANAEILVGCSPDSYEKEKNIFVAGEGGPTKIINSSMPVIVRGKILLYNESRSICDRPLLELHELIHVFGYDHIDKKDDIMYPYLNCNQEISSDLKNHLLQLYAIAPFAELSFDIDEISANKHKDYGKWYLDFNMSMDNTGIINAEAVVLKVYGNDKLVKSFDIDDIRFGGGERFYIKNLGISSSISVIKFEITTTTRESSTKNNILELTV